MAAEWTAPQIRDLLDVRTDAVERALVVLLSRQTDSERATGSTTHLNGVGFNAFDAAFLTSLAERVAGGRHLTPRQLTAARKALRKYSGQLARIANKEI